MNEPVNANEKKELPRLIRWPLGFAKFLLRAAAVFLFILYLGTTTVWAWQWFELSQARRYPLPMLMEEADKHLRMNRGDKFLDMIRARHKTERRTIMDMLEPYSGVLPSQTFLTYMHWTLSEKDADASLFWWYYARYRFRFDALRCGYPDGIKTVNRYFELIEPDTIRTLTAQTPAQTADMLQRVLDFDTQHPAQNMPTETCKIMYNQNMVKPAPLPREKWMAARHNLHRHTQKAIAEMRSQTAVPE